MLPKEFRLTVREFYQNPNRFKKYLSPTVAIFVKKSSSSHYRFTVSIPKAVHKSSVVRHRLKRKILETLRPLTKTSGAGCDVMIKVMSLGKSKNGEDIYIHCKEVLNMIHI